MALIVFFDPFNNPVKQVFSFPLHGFANLRLSDIIRELLLSDITQGHVLLTSSLMSHCHIAFDSSYPESSDITHVANQAPPIPTIIKDSSLSSYI